MTSRSTCGLVLVSTLTVLASTAARAVDEKPRPQAPPGTVTLPLADYETLLDRAARPPQPPRATEPPPVSATISRAEVKARVVGARVRGTVEIEGEVLRKGVTRVPLLGGATLLDARSGGRPLPMVYEGGIHQALLGGPGPFSLVLEWATVVGNEPGRAFLELPAVLSSTVRASVEVPGEHADVGLTRGLVTRRRHADGKTVVEATLSGPARVSWATRESAPTAPRDVRFLADVKSLASVGESEFRMVTLVDITVVQGEPTRFDLQVPAGLDVTGASGTTLEGTEQAAGSRKLTLVVREPAARRHQFLVSLERSLASQSERRLELSFAAVDGAQREAGEVAVEGSGTLDLQAAEQGGIRRLDVSETSGALRALARGPLLAAFRYQRRPAEDPVVALDLTRFADAPVLAAVAERATVTTLVTTEGRALTEVSLTVRNHAQPFLRVVLPEGATVLSADVAGQRVKPAQGADGARVPLLRPGFRPEGAYAVSFVYLQASSPFLRKGDARLGLPRMDLPVSLLEWELFLPDRYKVKDFGGNVLLDGPSAQTPAVAVTFPGGVLGDSAFTLNTSAVTGSQGLVAGRVTDETGAPLPGVTLTVTGSQGTRSTVSDAAGYYLVAGVPSGPVSVSAALSGFATASRQGVFQGSGALRADFALKVGTVSETITVTAQAPAIDTKSSASVMTFRDNFERERAEAQAARKQRDAGQQVPSANVVNLQRRVAGVLPVRVDVPRAGLSYRFVRPLVLDEETSVTFRYKRR